MYMSAIPNGFRERAISLYSSKSIDNKEILRKVSKSGIYCSSDNVGTVYLVQYIFENSAVNLSALCNSWEDSIQHVSIFGICYDVRLLSQNFYSVTVNSHNGQLTLHTDPHAGGKDNIGRQIQTTVQ
jgi:hypothetical protein